MTFPSDSGPAARRNAAAFLREGDAGDLDDAQLARRLSCAAKEPFDLARGPLLRIHLYRRTAAETVVLVVAHHFIADLWSMTTLVRELETLYIKQGGDLSAPLPQPAIADREVVRLYRWVGGTRAWVHAAQSRGFGNWAAGGRLSSAAS